MGKVIETVGALRELLSDCKDDEGIVIFSDTNTALYVADNFGSRVTAVRTVDLTNPKEWRWVVKDGKMLAGGK